MRKAVSLMCVALTFGMSSLAVTANGMTKTDKLFPKPPALLEYERVGEMCKAETYKGENVRKSLPRIAQLAKEPLRLAPDHAWENDPNTYYINYYGGRLSPALVAIRWVWRGNRDYAKGLSAQGRGREAIAVLLTNLDIARQESHIQPVELVSLIAGNGLWQGTWDSIAKQMKLMGEKSLAERAAACSRQSKVFTASRVEPVLHANMQSSVALEREANRLPKSKRYEFERRKWMESIREESAKTQQLTKQWDAEVDTVACKQLVKELRKMAQQN